MQFKENIFEEFWTEGLGKAFLKWTNANPKLEDFREYDRLFHSYDNEMDEIVKNAMANKSMGKIMLGLNDENSKDHFPIELNQLIEDMKTEPKWLNPELLKAGAELSERSGLSGLLVLRNFSLMGGYYFSNLTKPLVATGALEKGPTHRLYYTLQFWIDVSRTSKNAQKLRMNACLRTRLMHSVARLAILKKNPDWDIDDLGVPINLADMIATNIGFSFYYLFGLKQLNFNYTEDEENGVFHLWKYVTWLLGVPAEYSPNNKREAIEFFYYWTSKQNRPDEDSRKLAAALMRENTAVRLLKFNGIKKQMPLIHKSLSNYLLDEQVKTALEIQEVKLSPFIANFLKVQNKIHSIRRKEKQMIKGNQAQRSVLADYEANSKAYKNI